MAGKLLTSIRRLTSRSVSYPYFFPNVKHVFSKCMPHSLSKHFIWQARPCEQTRMQTGQHFLHRLQDLQRFEFCTPHPFVAGKGFSSRNGDSNLVIEQLRKLCLNFKSSPLVSPNVSCLHGSNRKRRYQKFRLVVGNINSCLT